MTPDELRRKVEVILREPPDSYTEWTNELIAVVLEEAARVAGSIGDDAITNLAPAEHRGYMRATAMDAAAAIRALIRE